ncbi:MAG: hypothetical protein DRG78_03420 [Epsilonproteobacteria bacterium]|nr:MAG: hypothetical protein DRG78_03420 [Campylobacterota bacterium]
MKNILESTDDLMIEMAEHPTQLSPSSETAINKKKAGAVDKHTEQDKQTATSKDSSRVTKHFGAAEKPIKDNPNGTKSNV